MERRGGGFNGQVPTNLVAWWWFWIWNFCVCSLCRCNLLTQRSGDNPRRSTLLCSLCARSGSTLHGWGREDASSEVARSFGRRWSPEHHSSTGLPGLPWTGHWNADLSLVDWITVCWDRGHRSRSNRPGDCAPHRNGSEKNLNSDIEHRILQPFKRLTRRSNCPPYH